MNEEIKSKDFQNITKLQQRTWSSGDFNEIAHQNVWMAETLCQAVDPQPGQRVLDIACGSGNAALVAARRYCQVSGIDYVPKLIGRAKRRAEADGLEVDFRLADAQSLPFPDDSFDVVLSVYGVQFAPNQKKAADELLRVCRPGGKIGLAGPIPKGWSGDFFMTHGRFVPPQPNVKPPLRWGTTEGLNELLARGVSDIQNKKLTSLQYYLSINHALDVFSSYFGPTMRALRTLDGDKRQLFLDELKSVFKRYNRATNGTAVVENQYLQTIAICA
jgi:ubiquinone/menaquinone biosynthesis C-methylase UbiE